jgi:hypothetical protein
MVVATLFAFTCNNSFFRDTIQLGSQHAGFYFENNFRKILLPDSIDSGHIPAFGMYIAMVWKVFSRSIIVSHLAMLPFIAGILWQLQILVKKFINNEYTGLVYLLILVDPTLLSQITLISPDVPLVFFFFLGLNCILKNRRILLSISIAGLFLTSMRGMMVSVCLLVIDVVQNISMKKPIRDSIKSLLSRSLIYLPALLIFTSFNLYHYLEKGWIGFHDNSPWAELFKRVPFEGVLFNIGILGWRIIDFGRIGIWIVFFILIFMFRRKILTEDSRLLFLIFATFLVLLPLNMIWSKNLLGHRYLLPVYLSFSLLTAHLLFTLPLSERVRSALVVFWLLVLTTGNLWIYPDKIAQGWDSTLAHLPYFKVRERTIEYLDDQNIDFQKVQSFFPFTGCIDDIDLNHDNRGFSDFANSAEYVVYSNVFNVSRKEYDIIKSRYTVIMQFNRGRIHMDVCRKKE